MKGFLDREAMEEANMFPSHLFLGADMWLLSTAICLVADLEVQEYVSIAKDPHASVVKEIYQIAVGSFKAGKLELQWDVVEEDYWVNPDGFLQWCMKKGICENSMMIDFYKNTVMKKIHDCLAKVIGEDPEEIQEIRKMHPATVVKHRTLAMVDYNMNRIAMTAKDPLDGIAIN
jgi:hypothetical protein